MQKKKKMISLCLVSCSLCFERINCGLSRRGPWDGGGAGNKGGVAARMKIKSTTICFVCAHLAAGQSNVNDRIDDYHDITKGIVFGRGTARVLHANSNNGKGMADGTLCAPPR
jgi:hypothetical protein